MRYLLFLFVLFSLHVLPSDSLADFRNSHGDFFRLYRSDGSDIKFRYIYEPGHEEKDGPGEFDLNDFNGAMELVMPMSDELYLRGGAEYDAKLYDFTRVVGAKTETDGTTLHKVLFKGGAGVFLSDDFLVTGLASVGALSDFESSLDTDDVAVYGEGMLVWRLNPGAQLVGGVATDEVFDDTSVYPLFGFRMLSSDGALHISLTVPREVRVGYNVSPSLQVYGGGWISGDQYNVEMGPNKESFNVYTRDNRVGAGLLFWLGNHANLFVEGGININGELKFKVEDAGQFEDGDLDNSGYLSAGLGFAL